MEKTLLINNEKIIIKKFVKENGVLKFTLNGKAYQYKLIFEKGNQITLENNNLKKKVLVLDLEEYLYKDCIFKMKLESKFEGKRSRSQSQSDEGPMLSPMPGKIFKIFVKEGQKIKKGEALLIMEAMKMEHVVKASEDGIIKKILFNIGELVDGGVPLVLLEEEKPC